MSDSQEKQSQSTNEAIAPIVEAGVKAVVPGGGVVVKIAQALTQRGEYSFDHQSMPTYIQFISEDLAQISKNVQKLLELENRKKPDVADIAATLEAIGEASRTTTNYKKRELLRHAAINAFDPEFYEEGLVRRFLRSIEELEYGDVALLRKMVRHFRDLDGKSFKLKDIGVNARGGRRLSDYHYGKLTEAGMLGGDGINGWCFPTEYSERFLAFVTDPKDSSHSGEGKGTGGSGNSQTGSPDGTGDARKVFTTESWSVPDDDAIGQYLLSTVPAGSVNRVTRDLYHMVCEGDGESMKRMEFHVLDDPQPEVWKPLAGLYCDLDTVNRKSEEEHVLLVVLRGSRKEAEELLETMHKFMFKCFNPPRLRAFIAIDTASANGPRKLKHVGVYPTGSD